MKRLWARVGTTIKCTDKEYEKLKELMKTNTSKAQDFLWELYYMNHELDGNSYLPPDVDNNPNHEEFDF